LVAPGSIHFGSVFFFGGFHFGKPPRKLGRYNMPFYMYQGAYTSQSWAAQVKNPQNRIETVGRQACEAVGGKMVGAWYCFGDFDFILIADVPNNESMTAISLAVAAGGAIKNSRTTPLMTGAQAVEAMKKVADVAKVYRPAT
jgi:uncharacterized protein with GYD domain